MSNCVNLYTRVDVSFNDFDWRAFNEAAQKYANLKRDDIWNEETKTYKTPEYFWYWFLNGSFKLDFRGLKIRLFNTDGRSTYTWRDLRQTLHYLSQFFKNPCIIRIRMSDEFDGYRTKFVQSFNMPYNYE